MKKRLWNTLTPLILLVLFVGAYAYLGYQLHADSDQYIQLHIRRGPVYPLWLLFLRKVFGEARYLWVSGLIQCIFTALGLWWFAEKLARVLSEGYLFRVVALVLAVLPQPMSYFASVTHLYLAGDIMSESFAYPHFLMTVPYLIAMCIGRGKGNPLKEKETWISLASMFVLSLLRGTFMILGIAWMMILIFRLVRDCRRQMRTVGTGIVLTLLCGILFFALRNVCLKSYIYMSAGRYETHNNTMNLALGNVLYVTTPDDAAYVPEEDPLPDRQPDLTLREYFYLLYGKMEEMRLNIRYETGSRYERIYYMEVSNDPLKFEVVEEIIHGAIAPYEEEYAVKETLENEVSGQLVRALMPAVWQRWLIVYLRNIFQGLIRSIGVTHPVLDWVFVAVYVSAVLLMIRCFRTGRISGAYAMGTELLIILGTVASIGLIQFCISRYTVYAFPVFYSAYFKMLKDLKG